jgi:tetratricopeptide (TPR) repeat protein
LLWFATRQSDARDYAVSEALYRTAVEQCRAIHDGDHPDTALVLARLAHLLVRIGADDAETTCREALAMLERLYDKPHPDTGWVLHDLGVVLSAGGKHAEAATTLRRAIEIRRAALGEDHELVAYSLERLASVVEPAGEPRTELANVRREAWRIRKSANGENDPRAAVAERHLAVALSSLPGQENEAERHFRHAVDVLRNAEGDQRVRLALAYDDLAWFAFEQRGDFAEAVSFTREVVRIREDVHGADHRMAWRARRRLAYFLAAPTFATIEQILEAVALAEEVVRHEDDRYGWQTLAMARLRDENWQGAADAVRRSDELANTSSSINRLIVALAIWRLDDRNSARAEVDEVMAQYAGRNLGRLRTMFVAEFRELMNDVSPDAARSEDRPQRASPIVATEP